ncbi:MAG: hypothetical protein ACKPAC_22830, partial [Alphaproteobacteria bacterium]
PAPRGFEGFVSRLGGVAMLVALSAGGLLLAAVALVAIGVLLPIVLAAGAIGAITIWWRLRKARARGESTIIIKQFDRRDG